MDILLRKYNDRIVYIYFYIKGLRVFFTSKWDLPEKKLYDSVWFDSNNS